MFFIFLLLTSTVLVVYSSLTANSSALIVNNISNSTRTLKILIFSVNVGPTPLNASLNHQIYCESNGYEYVNFYFTHDHFQTKYGNVPPAWASVMVVQDLFATSDADYFIKLDLDCVFLRKDLGFEPFIDPLDRYSFYISETALNSRFMNSHSWIIKNKSPFSVAFIQEWSHYRAAGNCGDVAAEQGSLNMLVAKKFSDLKINLLTNETVTEIECHQKCHTRRSAWHIQGCVQQWFENNNMSSGGGTSSVGRSLHPDILILPAPHRHNSPEDGWTFTRHTKATDLLPNEQPLTYHPCKNMFYEKPEYVREHWKECH